MKIENVHQIIRRRDFWAVITMVLMLITTVAGILSLNFNYSYEFTNQYGHTVTIYGYGIYAFDTYFQAPVSIGTDYCILFILIPMFLYTYIIYRKGNDSISELKLISVYAVALYYAASISFGLAYNQLFLVYIALFTSSLFGLFMHIGNITWKQGVRVTNKMKIFLLLCGIALIIAWLPDVIPSLIKGTTLETIGIYTTSITYVLDMGILSSLCFVCIYLLIKGKPLGTMILAILLRLNMVVGIMMIPQTICQMISGVNLPLPALITKSISFVLLGGYGFKPHIVFTTSQLEFIIELVELNKGIAIIPMLHPLIKSINNNIAAISFDEESFFIEVGFIMKKHKNFNFITQTFITHIKKCLGKKRVQ